MFACLFVDLFVCIFVCKFVCLCGLLFVFYSHVTHVLSSGDSDDSDTDSEEEGGFDSDVELEKNRTYDDKIYANPMRKTKETKPYMKEEKAVERFVCVLEEGRELG